jgi:ParB-like chromosome segregation protein Spo0J
MKIQEIKPNPNNPRIIKDHKFKQLVKSIQDFPQMLELRPIVIDENNMVLGGNMRLKACLEAGLTEVPVKIASGLSVKQQREFIVKDNVGYGEWDWDLLANEWDSEDLSEWGLDVPKFNFDNDEEPEIDKNLLGNTLDKYLNNNIKQIVLYFENENYEPTMIRLDSIAKANDLEDNSQVLLLLLEKYETK